MGGTKNNQNSIQKIQKIKIIDLSQILELEIPKFLKNYKFSHKARNLINDSIYSISEFSKIISNYESLLIQDVIRHLYCYL